MSSINKVAALNVGLKPPRTEQLLHQSGGHISHYTLAWKNGKISSRPGKGIDGKLLFVVR